MGKIYVILLCVIASLQVSAGELSVLNGDANGARNNGKTALMLAARDRDRELVDRLLGKGADVNAVNDNGGTPIMYAALGGDAEIVHEFIERKADVNAVAKNGWSALMIAAAKGYTDVMRLLLANGADPNLEDVYLWSPLMRAVYEDREEIVNALVRQPRTDLNHRGENGITALHIATARDYPHLAEILLEHGADKTLKDDAGRTPYQIAKEKKDAKLLYLLEIN